MKQPKVVKFDYEISPNYAVYAIAGVHGGIVPQGAIILNCFSERHSIPKQEVFEIGEGGRLGQAIEKAQRDSIIRDVLFGLQITPTTARSIAKWLAEKADDADRLLLGQRKGKEPS